ncbi:MAG: hypothetical protein FWD12_09330 [Alphaproteobacteria bacterium]|nr:hypothetical protein [Alphaproteobacteria bacterium]
MRDLVLQFSGLLAIAAAATHAVLTETKVFPRVTIEPRRLRTLFRLVWQIPTVAWIACGVLLIAAPSMGSQAARHWMIATFACLFAFSAVSNAWGTRGKHFGWILLGAVAALAVAGY